jgi:type II secretory pathway pseudopilin PulG
MGQATKIQKGTSMKYRKRNAGYSLVEVTLALLVVAIGLTATFAIFPDGLRATRAAVDDTEISLFAEYVFTTLDLTAILKGSSWTVNDCKAFKSMVLDGNENDPRFKLKETSGDETAVFYWTAKDYGYAKSQDYNADNFKDFWASAFTYQLELYDWEDGSTYALLNVWPGEYTSPVKPPEKQKRVFTRAIQAIRGEALP